MASACLVLLSVLENVLSVNREPALEAGLQSSMADLDEALAIATRSGARLHLAMDEKTQARQSLAQAKAIIEATGYHRRDPEVAALERQLKE